MKTKLPTYSQATLAVLMEEQGEKKATPLERFIYEEQPVAVSKEEFRNNLEDLVEYFDKQRRHAEQLVAFITAFGGVIGLIVLQLIM